MVGKHSISVVGFGMRVGACHVGRGCTKVAGGVAYRLKCVPKWQGCTIWVVGVCIVHDCTVG